MPNPDELIAILDRILNGSRDESEVAQLRQWLTVSGTTLQFVSQDGKFNTNIGQVQGGEIHIGDRHYQFDVEALRELLQPTTPLPNIDWHAVSQAMLEEQLRLTTNPLTSGEGISYRTEQVYVPLGLVERKRQTRRGEDVSPEQGSLLYEETEITQRFEHEQFLDRVLRQGQSPKSQGKRLAIIGEPGAGKTTLLQQIAQWVSEQGEGAIAIWVSLADLRGQELEAYLLEGWLQAVARKLGQAEASSQVKDAFVAQTGQGRVWLLLDGVDEMQVSSGNPLAEISRQVRMGGLLSQARIVLSCRLNLWDGDRNALDTFDTYRTLEFSYPQNVERFIGQWFRALPEGQGGQAERLCAALKAPGKERIRDLVKNPLRLTLLCFNWYLKEGTLPETKAGLYEQFVADFYEWKREQFPTTSEQRRQLNAALRELAREAIDKEATRFRLRHDFVCEFLGEPDEPNSLLQLALQLGWLNKVGVEAENPRKVVYAFFHPTFQEYFAALAIDDWHYFLNHIPENPSHPDAHYRIFQSQWKEVFLLWLGREISTILSDEYKKEILNALMHFDDQCEGFYWYQAYFLAATGLAELRKFDSEEVIVQLLKWSGELRTIRYFEPISKAAMETLHSLRFTKIKTSPFEVMKENTDYIHTQFCERTIDEYELDLSRRGKTENRITKPHATRNSKNIPSQNKIKANQLTNIDKVKLSIDFLENSSDGDSKRQAIYELKMYGAGNSDAVNTLIDYIPKTQDRYTLWKIIESLGEMAVNSIDVINRINETLTNLMRNHEDECTRLLAAKSLGGFCSDNIAITTLVELVNTSHNMSVKQEAIESIAEILMKRDIGDREAISILLRLLSLFKEGRGVVKVIESLEKIGMGDMEVVSALLKVFLKTGSEDVADKSYSILKFFLKEIIVPEALIPLKKRLKLPVIGNDFKTYYFVRRHGWGLEQKYLNDKNFKRHELCHSLIWIYAQKIPYPEFWIMWNK